MITLRTLPLLLASIMTVGCGHGEVARRMSSREIASNLLTLKLETQALQEIVNHPAAEKSLGKWAVSFLDQDIDYLANLLRQAGSGRQADFTLVGAAQVGQSLAGLEYDLIRTDVQATMRGIGHKVRYACESGIQTTRQGMDAIRSNPARATDDVLGVDRILVSAEGLRDSAMQAAPVANVVKVGVLAANLVSSPVTLAQLGRAGPAVLARLMNWMRGIRLELASIELVNLGAGAVGMRLISTGGAIAIADTEVLALVQAGVLSETTWTLYMMANGRVPKTPDPKAFSGWIKQFPTKSTPTSGPENIYEIKHTGPVNYKIKVGDIKINADGVRAADAHLLEAKYVGDPAASPYIDGSTCFEQVRLKIRGEVAKEFRAYAAVIQDPNTPAVALEVITNDSRAVPFFEALMRELGIPGRVIVLPP